MKPAILLFILATAALTAQEAVPDGRIVIKADSGFVVIWNQDDTHFTYHLQSEKVSLVPNTQFFDVDGKNFQIQIIPIKQFSKDPKRTQAQILDDHFSWEIDWLSKEALKTKLETEKKKHTLTGDRPTLVWHFLMPEKLNPKVVVTKEGEPDEQVETAKIKTPLPFAQCYITTIDHQNLILMNTLAQKKEDLPATRDFLLGELKKIKYSDKKIDPKAVQKAIREGIAKDKTEDSSPNIPTETRAK